MNMTSKQRQITDTVIKGNPDGSWLDIDQLVENVPYETSKDSMHFSLRALIKKGLIEKKDLELRRGQERRIIAPTSLAYETRRSV
jgi:predicted transcriptional regulator